MRLVLCASLALAVSAFAQSPDPKFQSKQAYQEFLRTTPGQWVAQWHPATITPRAIYGNGIRLANWHENTLEHARIHANRMLADHRDLLGLGTSDFRESIGARMGRTWSFKFDQFFHGLPVIGGRADVRINMTGVVAMMGSTAFPIPADFVTVPKIGEELATATAWQQVGDLAGAPQPGQQRAPQLVIWGDTDAADAAPFFLAWEIPVSNVDRSGQGPIGRYYIDAQTGEVLHYRSDKHECGFASCTNAHHGIDRTAVLGPVLPVATAPLPLPVPTTVTVMAWTRVGVDAFNPLVNTPLPGVVLNVPGIGFRTTDANGQFTIDIAAPVTITASVLDGTHYQPMVGPNGPAISGTVTPGVPATIQIGASSSNEFEAAHTTAAYWVDRSNEWCRTILGNSSQMNTASNINCEVNINNNCNAYYTGNSINFYTSGGGCSNTAFSTVIAHEWGHGLDDRYGGISNTNAEGVSEGWGDILGLYLLDTPLLGSGFQSPGVALRRGDNTYMYPYSGSSPHAAGQVWMGFAWRLRQALRASYGTPTAIAITEDIVIGSIVADATTRAQAVLEVFIADDNDGNLNNGTPNYNELSAAAIAKNLPYPPILVAAVTHAPLGNTGDRLTPRKVDCTAAVTSTGSITGVTLHYSASGGPTQVRNMHPSGAPNGYEAMLPGLSSGLVTYWIEAVHNGTTTVRSPATGNYSYTVDANSGGTFTPFWTDSFDGATSNWTSAQVLAQNDWQRGDPAGRSGTSQGVAWADPQTAASAPNCWANDLGNTIGTTLWNGAYAANVENYLRSPIINCSGRTGVAIRFKRWLTVEEGIYDQATLSVNGIQVWQNQQNGHHVDTSWNNVQYSLPMADNNPVVQIEFRLKSDAGLHLGGWNIDDIEIGELFVPPLDATLEMLPEQSVQAGPMSMTVTTSGAARPFVIAIGDTAGPTIFPGIPPILVGGNLVSLPGWTNGTGAFTFGFNAPAVASTVGTIWYSQAVTLDPTNTQIITSNRFLNLFTMTP